MRLELRETTDASVPGFGQDAARADPSRGMTSRSDRSCIVGKDGTSTNGDQKDPDEVAAAIGEACQDCGAPAQHRSHVRGPDDEPGVLLSLCDDCHRARFAP
jgi:hypothetical protein